MTKSSGNLIAGLLRFIAITPLLCAYAAKQNAESYFPSLSGAEKEEYQSWLDTSFSLYTHHSFLPSSGDPELGAAVFWKIEDEEIDFAVAVRATGWLGFGISEVGGMLGADVVLFTVSEPNQLVDSYILEDRAAPLTDKCQSWNLVSSRTAGGWIIVEMNRPLDTGDLQDRPIINDSDLWISPTRLIAAWGDTETVSYHGLNRARHSVRLFGDTEDSDDAAQTLEETLLGQADGFFDVREDNHLVAAEETVYHYVCKDFSDVKQERSFSDNSLTMIGALPLVSEETAPFVHHFTVYLQSSCGDDFGLDQSMVYAWAPGDEGLLLPDDVGFQLFANPNEQALRLEIHYNNQNLITGQHDSSGVRFFYSNQQRAQAAAILQLGDPFVALYGEPIDEGLTKYEFTCPGSCSSTFLGGNSVTVLAEYLHMHKAGVRMTNELIRDYQVVHESKIDVFEFDQQGNPKVQQPPFEVSSGDSFRTTCYYRDGSQFGTGSQEEMCIAFVMYYPAMESNGYPWMCPYGLDTDCGQQLSYMNLKDEDELGRDFGGFGDECPASPTPSPSTSVPTAEESSGYVNGTIPLLTIFSFSALFAFGLS